MSITILLVEDHQIVREALHVMLDRLPDLRVIAEAADGLAAIKQAQSARPDVVLMDITMPVLNGIEATRKIHEAMPDIRIIALSMHTEQHYVEEMIRAGASGYLSKDIPSTELGQAIRDVMRGEVYIGSRLAGRLLKGYLLGVPEVGPTVFARITAREREVLQLVAEGHTTLEIAELLNISINTVETHRKQLMEKLNLHTIAGLTRYAIREGLTPLEWEGA